MVKRTDLGEARESYLAELRTAWCDTYHKAISEAKKGNSEPLVEKLRSNRPIDDDSFRAVHDALAELPRSSQARDRRGPNEIRAGLVEWLDNVAQKGKRKRGLKPVAANHDAAELFRALRDIEMVNENTKKLRDGRREQIIANACEAAKRYFAGPISPESVEKIIDNFNRRRR